MNTTKLRRKRIILPTIAAVAVLGVGGVVWAATANDDLQGSERDRVGAAAVEAAGGGTVVDVEASDDRARPTRSRSAWTTAPRSTSPSTRT